MYQGNKANLLKYLEPIAPHPLTIPEIHVKILDGAALVHKLEPKHVSTVVKTFSDNADIAFLPYLFKQLQVVIQVDVVWDCYTSLKVHVR